jgi:hypothetical protein
VLSVTWMALLHNNPTHSANSGRKFHTRIYLTTEIMYQNFWRIQHPKWHT